MRTMDDLFLHFLQDIYYAGASAKAGEDDEDDERKEADEDEEPGEDDAQGKPGTVRKSKVKA